MPTVSKYPVITVVGQEIKELKAVRIATGAKEGFIVNFNQEDNIEGIALLPAWKWLGSE